MTKKLIGVLVVLSLPGLSAARPPAKLAVYTVNYPLQYFAERIAGDEAEVVFPAPRNLNPAFWRPQPAEIAKLQGADLILINGASYAKWVTQASLPPSRVMDTSRKYKDRYIAVPGAMTHSHGAGGEHSHSGIAGTTWLDFSLAVQQSEAILKALSRKRPDAAAKFEQNFARLKADLLALDEEMKRVVPKKSNPPLIGSHPIYQYLKRAYGLNLESVTWDPQEVPSEKLWKELELGLKSFPAKWMVWEGAPHKDSVARLQTLGMRSLVFDPCANVPEKGDFLSAMRQNIKNLDEALK
ncbi:MAG: zinc ABC transporter substrate-binding protein [Elusimicrobiota bacterium]